MDDRALLASLRDALANTRKAIDQSLSAIASTREAIAFLDRLEAHLNQGATDSVENGAGTPMATTIRFGKHQKRAHGRDRT
jgi:hypothetical protein